ncbi:hypothetical protein H696_03840 [Fonticula alba]|uniref:Sulfotransferase domain-containing protein n=1 Tax=Fonticula alba TaxID=691883 RepID=A0A058Z561_FONAL|nr:hypothetical protein H696_03840 [Fonticula alba]KCV69409.1 hypothetical protein H696_03840 [Fonticula alba]|eukprot:XP_009495974.1 hypothetical protein H696_03840 [Fonticula alba]
MSSTAEVAAELAADCLQLCTSACSRGISGVLSLDPSRVASCLGSQAAAGGVLAPTGEVAALLGSATPTRLQTLFWAWLTTVGGMPPFLTQLPLLAYVFASLHDSDVDAAFFRLCVSYGVPVFLWWCFSRHIVLGLVAVLVLYKLFTRSVPYSPIRVPSGALRRLTRRVTNTRVFRAVLGNEQVQDGSDLDLVNPYAMSVFVRAVTPLVLLLNRVLDYIPRKPVRPKTIEGPKIAYLFHVINKIDAFLARYLPASLAKPKRMQSPLLPLPIKLTHLRAERAVREGAIDGDHSADAALLFLRGMLDPVDPENPCGIDAPGFPPVDPARQTAHRLTATGRLLVSNWLSGNFDTRYVVHRYINQHPEIQNIRIRAPLMILGLPRTGSTFLQHLLAADPRARHLRFWEMNLPVPPPKRDTYLTDDRARLVDTSLQSLGIISPDYFTALAEFHEIRGYGIEEELLILQHGVALFSHYFLAGEDSAFHDWFMDPNNKAYLYRYFRLFLQLLAYQYEPVSHWVLKAPVHSLYPEALFNEFPDLRAVNTHRDPRYVLASWTKFQVQMLSIYQPDDRDLGPPYAVLTYKMLLNMANRLMDLRDKLGPELDRKHFFDIELVDMSADPVGTVRRVYDHFGMDFDGADNFPQRILATAKSERDRSDRLRKVSVKRRAASGALSLSDTVGGNSHLIQQQLKQQQQQQQQQDYLQQRERSAASTVASPVATPPSLSLSTLSTPSSPRLPVSDTHGSGLCRQFTSADIKNSRELALYGIDELRMEHDFARYYGRHLPSVRLYIYNGHSSAEWLSFGQAIGQAAGPGACPCRRSSDPMPDLSATAPISGQDASSLSSDDGEDSSSVDLLATAPAVQATAGGVSFSLAGVDGGDVQRFASAADGQATTTRRRVASQQAVSE